MRSTGNQKQVCQTQYARRKQHWMTAVILLAGFALGSIPPTVIAQDSNKTVSWTVSAGNEQIRGFQGKYRIAERPWAGCADDGTDYPVGLNRTSAWKVTDGVFDFVTDLAVVNHADTWTWASILSPAATNNSNGTWTIKATEDVDIAINVAVDPEGYSKGKGFAKSESWITGEKARGRAPVNAAGAVRVWRNTKQGWVWRNQGTKLELDPVTITLEDMDTGDTYTEELFHLTIDASGENGSFEWDYNNDTGFSIHAPKNENGQLNTQFSLDGAGSSDWLDDPFGSFGVSLDNGIFEATGVWADLPWDLTYDGFDVVAAVLSPDYLPSVFNYTIPEQLFNADHEYRQILGISNEISGMEALVPNPATISMLTASALLVGIRRRRV